MGVGEADAAEIWHWVALDPNDVVENPVTEVLQDAADAVDVMVGTDHPKRSGGFEHTPAFAEPLAREVIVDFEAFELVPILGDPIHLADVRPPKVTLKLEVVGRVRKNQVHRLRGQGRQNLEAVAFDDCVDPGFQRIFGHGHSIVLARESGNEKFLLQGD